MPLINLKTDLKSLRYGKDTLGGGYSGQPYIQTPIPESFNDLGAREDFILRGGIDAVSDSLTDIKRLGKMFTDTKSPNGLLFIAKQQLLSRTAARTQTSGILNEGVYSPLNTLAEAGVVAFGGHLNKQGINPFAQTGAYANNDALYSTRVKYNQPNNENRLVLLYSGSFVENKSYTVNGIKLNDGQNVMVYTGGPGSILGIGSTGIRYVSPVNRTGINNSNGKSIDAGTYQTQRPINRNSLIKPPLGVSNEWFNTTKETDFVSFPELTVDAGYTYELNTNISVYLPKKAGTFPETNKDKIHANNTWTYNQQDIIKPYETVQIGPDDPTTTSERQGSIASPKIQDFRAILRTKLQGTEKSKAEQSGATPEAPNYNRLNIENRVLLGDPGQRSGKSYFDYEKGVEFANPDGTSTGNSAYSSINVQSGTTPLGTYQPGLDKITSIPVYRSETVASEKYVNDLVKFRIAVIDNDSPNFKTYIHFRAFIDSMSDSYNATWNGFNYLGRGEQFYTYGGFTRQISLSWTVVAQSKQELIPMYKKLNYLASSLTPDYSPNGYMRGNLVQLTVGGYVYEQPGFITALTYDVPSESPWEIGLGSSEAGSEDPTVKELPHMIKVTGFSFTPIQTFRPQIQQNSYAFNNNTTGSVTDDFGFVNNYGDQRYISLANGANAVNNNYDY